MGLPEETAEGELDNDWMHIDRWWGLMEAVHQDASNQVRITFINLSPEWLQIVQSTSPQEGQKLLEFRQEGFLTVSEVIGEILRDLTNVLGIQLKQCSPVVSGNERHLVPGPAKKPVFAHFQESFQRLLGFAGRIIAELHVANDDRLKTGICLHDWC
jgi:hypothetical protein